MSPLFNGTDQDEGSSACQGRPLGVMFLTLLAPNVCLARIFNVSNSNCIRMIVFTHFFKFPYICWQFISGET